MGIFKLFSFSSDKRNPDPKHFVVIQQLAVNNLYLSVLKYANCTNYEGKKIILSTIDPWTSKSFDPHFMEDGVVIARFAPTKEGWKLGLIMLRHLLEEKKNGTGE